MDLTHMAKDLVKAMILAHPLTPDDAQALLRETHATLQALAAGDSPAAAPVPEAAAAVPDWRESITRYTVTCLECSEKFKQLSQRHLRVHDLNPRTYRYKYGIPRTQALSGRNITRRRKELAQQIRPWELAHQAKAKTAAKGNRQDSQSRRS